MNPNQIMMAQESLRRRASMPPSLAGIPGANTPSISNPIANAGQVSSPIVPGGGGAAGFPSEGAAGALKTQQPDEATFIVKALSDRLKKLSDSLLPPKPSSQAPATPDMSNIPTNGADIAQLALQMSGMG